MGEFPSFGSELQISSEKASTTWNEVTQIRTSVELHLESHTFFHTSGAPGLHIQQSAWKRFMKVVQKYFCSVSSTVCVDISTQQ